MAGVEFVLALWLLSRRVAADTVVAAMADMKLKCSSAPEGVDFDKLKIV